DHSAVGAFALSQLASRNRHLHFSGGHTDPGIDAYFCTKNSRFISSSSHHWALDDPDDRTVFAPSLSATRGTCPHRKKIGVWAFGFKLTHNQLHHRLLVGPLPYRRDDRQRAAF